MASVATSDVLLSYDLRGSGEPVLLICGTGQPAAMWDLGTRSALEDAGYTTVAFDNRGMPPSGCPPPPYSLEEMTQDTIALMENLGLGRYRIAGASLGACIAQTVALSRPDLVRAAVLMVGGGNYSRYFQLKMQASAAVLRAGEPEVADLYWSSIMAEAMLTPTQQQDDEAVSVAQERRIEWVLMPESSIVRRDPRSPRVASQTPNKRTIAPQERSAVALDCVIPEIPIKPKRSPPAAIAICACRLLKVCVGFKVLIGQELDTTWTGGLLVRTM